MIDLIALAMVNLFTAALLYLLFSLRSSRAIEQSRQNPLTPQLKENIELTVQYINSSLELLDQKKQACYQMLRRAEALLKDDSKKTPDPDLKPAAKVKSKQHKSQNKKESKSNSKNKYTRPAEGKLKTAYTSSLKKFSSDYNAEEALDRLGADKAEITPLVPQAKDAYLLGASREHQENLVIAKRNSASSNESDSLRMIPQKLGEYVRSRFKWLDLNPKQTLRRPPPVSAPISVQGNNILVSKKEMQALKSINEGIDFESVDFKETLHKEFLPKEKEKFNYGAGKTALKAIGQTEISSLAQPRFSAAPLKKADLKLPLEFSQRAERIHKLLGQGYTKQEISFAAGLSLAQVNLITALPQSPRSLPPGPRRRRLAVE